MRKSLIALFATVAPIALTIAPANAQDCTITVGRVVATSGPLVDMGRETPWLDENKVKPINDAGGLQVGNRKCKIAYKIFDSKGTMAGSGEAATRAILEDKVDVVFAQGTPDTTNAPSDLCERYKVPWAPAEQALRSISTEVELGFDAETAWKEAARCLNCDVQTVFTREACIECDACVDICPMDCITFTVNGEEADLRTRLTAPALNLLQDLYVSDGLKSGRVMVKDEDVCLHCGLCAERCPTGAWDMRKSLIEITHAGPGCRDPKPAREAA